MKKALRNAIAILFAFVVIFLLVNVKLGFVYKEPQRLQVLYKPPLSIEKILDRIPQLQLEDQEKGIFKVDGISATDAKIKVDTMIGIMRSHIIPDPPDFSWTTYMDGLERILNNYINGEFGQFWKSGYTYTPITSEIGPMLGRTSTYFFAALGTGIALGTGLSILATRYKAARRLLDPVHRALLALPDFLVVVLITFFAIFISKFVTQRLVLIIQINDSEIPFAIPFATIALLPAVMIYGTLRSALKREMGRPYIATALAKGMSRTNVILKHALRNIWEDFFAVLPRATTAAVSSMIIAEATCKIYGIGGFIVFPYRSDPEGALFVCFTLAILAFAMHGLYALLRKWLIVPVKEADA